LKGRGRRIYGTPGTREGGKILRREGGRRGDRGNNVWISLTSF